MKHWNIFGKNSDYQKHISLTNSSKNNRDDNDLFNDGRILSINKTKDGFFAFQEGCDNCFVIELSKSEAIEALNEAIEWIKSGGL